MSIRDKIKEHFIGYVHLEEYRIAMTQFRGLMRTYQNLEDTMKGKPPKRRKRRANPSTDQSNSEGTD